MGSFEDSKEPVWIICPVSKTVTDVNPAAVSFSGYAEGKLIGKRVDELFTREGAEAILRRCIPFDRQPSKASAYTAGIIPFIKKDGSREKIEVHCRFSNGRQPRVLIMGKRIRSPITV